MPTPYSSSLSTHPPDPDKFGTFVRNSLETSPFQSFLVLVFIFILSIATTSWLMVQWLTPGPPNEAVSSKSGPSCGRAGTGKAGSDEATSQSEKWDWEGYRGSERFYLVREAAVDWAMSILVFNAWELGSVIEHHFLEWTEFRGNRV